MKTIRPVDETLYLQEERELAGRCVEVFRGQPLGTVRTSLSLALFAALTCYDDPLGALEDAYDELHANLQHSLGYTDDASGEEEAETKGIIVAAEA